MSNNVIPLDDSRESRVSTISQLGISKTVSNLKVDQKLRNFKNTEINLLFDTISRLSVTVSEFKENFCDSEHLLNRNTESFRCLAQLLVSSSSITRNRLYLFPPLEDPGIDVAFEFVEPEIQSDNVGIQKYKKLCKDANIVPISRVIRSLDTDTLDLKYYGLSEKQMKALMVVLKFNTYVHCLILQDNWLTQEMVQMVSDMIVENTVLQNLSLQECRIGIEGANILGEILSSLQLLKSLDLSYNSLGDEGLLYMKEGLCSNQSLKIINLSHNHLTEGSTETLEKMLTENKFLEDLDLSWNDLYSPVCTSAIFNALKKSDRLKKLNIAWNGIGDELALRPIAKYVGVSENLDKLDLSNNRICGQALRVIRRAILKNASLDTIKIGNNPYSPDEAHLLLTALAAKAKQPLNFMDMENMWIKKESKPVLAKIKVMGKMVKIAGILGDYEIHGPDVHKVYYDRARYLLTKAKKARAKKDLGHLILSLPEDFASPEEFEKLAKKLKMKKLLKDMELVQGLETMFVHPNNTIDTKKLVEDYKTYFPESTLPPAKPPKPKKGKKGKKGKEKQNEKEPQETQVTEVEQTINKSMIEGEQPELVPLVMERPSQQFRSKSVTMSPGPTVMPEDTESSQIRTEGKSVERTSSRPIIKHGSSVQFAAAPVQE